jgi:lysophospholipase L1-like esterase
MQKTLTKLKQQKPVTIVAVGDSTSVLSSLTRGQHNWFNYLHIGLAETYGDGIIYSINSSFCGGTVKQELSRLDRDVLRWNPDLVIISFGTNDAEGGEKNLETFKHDYRQMVSRIREICGSEILIRVHVPQVWGFGYSWEGKDLLPPGAEPGKPWPGKNATLDLYAREMVSLSKELKCDCCDHYHRWKEKNFPFKQPAYNPQGLCCRFLDILHPNAQGHLAMYRELAPLFGISKYFFYEEVAE